MYIIKQPSAAGSRLQVQINVTKVVQNVGSWGVGQQLWAGKVQEYIEQIVGSLQALASCPLTKGRLSRGRTGPQTTGRTQQLFNRLETTLTSSSSSATVGVMVL